MKILTLLLLFCLLAPARGAELFGVSLYQSSREQLRNAVKNAGVELVSEAGDDAFFDVYRAQSLLQDATFLYLGFVKADNLFAFAEYEFKGLNHPQLLNKLTRKYGQPGLVKALFITDRSYQWQSQGVTISLYQDWGAYKTRLTYYDPLRLKQLKSERAQFQETVQQQQQAYLEQAY